MTTGRLIWERWRHFADTRPDRDAIIHWIPGESPYRWTFAMLYAAAGVAAARLTRAGIRKGDVCALILRHDHRFYPTYMGVSLAGAIPAVLAYPNSRLHDDKFRAGLQGMARKSGLDWILTEREIEPSISPLIGEGSTVRGILYPLEPEPSGGKAGPDPAAVARGLAAVTPDSPMLLQHSSGTTGLQKAVVLSHQAVLDHVASYGAAIGLSETDRVASWLPLYHDMGLIAAFHLPLAFGIPSVQIDPFHWVMSPVMLLEAITAERCTLSWLPNFAYNFMADRIHQDDLDAIDLSSLRMVVNCSEPVRAESHQKFARRFRSHGLREGAMAACYAMAETTFAATQTAPGLDAPVIHVDRDRLSLGAAELVREDAAGPVRSCVSSGRPIPGCDLRVVDEQGRDLPEDRVGEVAIRSVSLFSGYSHNPAATAEVLRDGWCFSGDLGFAHRGEYFIVGRKKDIIIVAGKNLYPEDIEDAVNRVSGVIPGRAVAFGEDNAEAGTEQIAVIAETHLVSADDQDALRRRIIEAGMEMTLTFACVHLVPPRWLIKSSSGKLSRKANRDRILEGSRPA